MRFAVRRVSNYFIGSELAGIPVETDGKDAREGMLDIKTLDELMARSSTRPNATGSQSSRSPMTGSTDAEK